MIPAGSNVNMTILRTSEMGTPPNRGCWNYLQKYRTRVKASFICFSWNV